jgi:poly(3-hydroxybutyrate) depolymerase
MPILTVTDANGNDRNNVVIVPTAPDGSLVLAFHGGLGNPADFQSDINLESVLTNSYIVYVDADDNLANLWRHGANNTDVAYVHSLYQKVLYDYPLINASNVHLIGHSNGAMMCYKVAAFLDELNFKTITSLAGAYMCPEMFDSTAKLYHVHGDEDLVVPIAGNAKYPPLSETKTKVKATGNKFLELQGVNHRLLNMLQEFTVEDIKRHMGL